MELRNVTFCFYGGILSGWSVELENESYEKYVKWPKYSVTETFRSNYDMCPGVIFLFSSSMLNISQSLKFIIYIWYNITF